MAPSLKQNTGLKSGQASETSASTLTAPSTTSPSQGQEAGSSMSSAAVQTAMADSMGLDDQRQEEASTGTREPLDSKAMATNAVERFFGSDALNNQIARHWATGQPEGTTASDFYKLAAEDRKAFSTQFFAESVSVDLSKGSTSPIAQQQVKRAYLDAQMCASNAERQIKKSGVEDNAVIQSAMQGAAFASVATSYFETNSSNKYGAEQQAKTGKYPASHDGATALAGLKKAIEKRTWSPEIKTNALANVDWVAGALDTATANGNQKAAAAIAAVVIALEAANWVKHPFTKPQTLGSVRASFRAAGAETPEAFGAALAAKLETAKYNASVGEDKAKWIKPNATYGMRQLFFRDGLNAPGAKAPDSAKSEA